MMLCALFAIFTTTLMARDAEWASEELLWSSATRSCPRNFVSHVLLGNVYDKQGTPCY